MKQLSVDLDFKFHLICLPLCLTELFAEFCAWYFRLMQYENTTALYINVS